jgi:hypothetical protein
MITSRHPLAIASLLVVCLAAPVPAADEAPAAKVSDLAWMTGHWSGPMGGATLEENWIEPTAKTIAAVVRAASADATSMIEYIIISEENGTLMLRVQQFNPDFTPKTPAPQVLELVESAPNKVVFGATADGMLKTLGYSRPQPDQFVISIETPQGGKFDIKLAAKKAA